MRKFLTIIALLSCVAGFAQVDRKDVRRGNRQFRKGEFAAAEVSYRRALLQDTTFLPTRYNLANALYREEDYEGARKQLDAVKDQAPAAAEAPQYYYNLGDVALQQQDWKAAMDAFRESLLRNPGDLDAKENYIYARNKYLEQQQQQQNQDQNQDQQNQDQNQNQDQQQNQDQNQDQQDQDQQQQQQQQQQDQNQDQQQQQQQEQPQDQQQLSAQQAAQLLQDVQAKEKETQDRVNKEKAAVLRSRQKEKNW
jgi:tetratricopeptide (TPR) repeat protein